MASDLTTLVANFRTSLASKVSFGDTTLQIVNNIDKDGVALPSGVYGFTISEGKTDEEHIVGNLSGNIVSNIVTVDRQNGQPIATGIAMAEGHRRGSSIKITNWVPIARHRDLLDARTGFDATDPIFYDAQPNITQADEIPSWGNVLQAIQASFLPPVVVSTSQGSTGLVVGQITPFAHTIPVGLTSGGSFVVIHTQEDVTVSSITLGAQNFVQVATETRAGSNQRIEIWRLLAPAAGTANITVTTSGNALSTAQVITLENVDQTTPVDALSTGADGSGTAVTDAITTVTSNSVILMGVGGDTNPTTFTPTAPLAQILVDDAGTLRPTSSSVRSTTTAGVYNLAYTIAPTQDFVTKAIAIRGVANGGGGSDAFTVGATSADTTPDFLDEKIEIVSSDSSVTVTKTIQNLGGDEKISYDLSAIGGGSGGGNLLYDAWDDFLGGIDQVGLTNVFQNISVLNWKGLSTSGANVGEYIPGEDGYPGIFRMDTTSGSDDAYIILGDEPTGKPISEFAKSGNEYNFIVRCNDTTSQASAVRIGIGAVSTGFNPMSAHSIEMVFNTLNNNLIFRTRGINVAIEDTTVVTGFTAVFYKIKIVCKGTSVECYIDDVLEATHSTEIPDVTELGTVKFIINNSEQLDIDFFGMKYGRELMTGGGTNIFSEQNLGGVGTSGGPSSSNVRSMTSEADGSVVYVSYWVSNLDRGYVARFEKDANTGFYKKTHQSGFISQWSSNSRGGAMAIVGSHVYLVATSSGNILRVQRFDKADLTNETNMTLPGSIVSAGNGAMFTGGTDLFIRNSAGTAWDRYTISGTTLTAGTGVTGGLSTANHAIQLGNRVIMSGGLDIQVFTYTTLFSLVASEQIYVGTLSQSNSDDSSCRGFALINITLIYIGYGQIFINSNLVNENLIIKPFTIPT